MKYMGSKARYAKHLLPIILKDRKLNQWYVEPFAGGFNMVVKVDGPRIANDINFYSTELFKALQTGWLPPDTLTEIEYNHIKANKEQYHPALVGFVGFGCSYSGMFFSSFARSTDAKGNPRNHCLESKRNILKQLHGLNGLTITNLSYKDIRIPPDSIIYCDPPYQGTTGYKVDFDHVIFWQWVRDKTNEGHKVYVSEYNAPADFDCIWQKEVKSSLVSTGTYKSNIEKLFTLI